MDAVFRAMADSKRRQLMDQLFEKDGQTLSQLVEPMGMSRQAVSKHVALLEAAGLVVVRRMGREKHHYLNPVPLRWVLDRWINKYAEPLVETMVHLKRALEHSKKEQNMDKPNHIYEIYIKARPEEVWAALTEGEMTRRYFHATHVSSEWQLGARVEYRMENGDLAVDGEILEIDAPRHLSFTWKVHYSEELATEPASRVTFDIEPLDEGCRVVLTHDQFEPGSRVHDQVSKGWSAIMCSMKSLLETGSAMAIQ